MPERFQARKLASFNHVQIGKVITWAGKHGIEVSQAGDSTEIFKHLLEEAETDEKGKPMNGKGRQRLTIACAVLTKLIESRRYPSDTSDPFRYIRGSISVWQTTPDPGILEMRWPVAYTDKWSGSEQILEHTATIRI